MTILRLSASRALPRARSSVSTHLGVPSKVSRVSRRGYASGGPPKPAASEIPWISGAAAATVGGLFLVSQSGTPKNPFVHPMPGDDWHGEGGHDEEHEEEEHEDEEASADDESTDEDTQGTSGDSEASSQTHTPGQKMSGKKMTEEPADGKMKTPVKGVEGEADLDGNYELDRPDTDRKVIHRPDARGGYKKRLESPKGIKQGELVFDEDSPDVDDSPAASKTPVKGSMSGKQWGLSNTDTKHSYDLTDMEHQKKGNGQPASSKSQGTVNARPDKYTKADGSHRQTDEPQVDSTE